MAFGQPSGPPATAKQVQELLGLLHDAGHVDFRDARGPMGLTQRQAGGRFTRDEASVLIDRLEAAASGGSDVETAPPADRVGRVDRTLAGVADARLAAELQRRGWMVIEPLGDA